MYKWEIVSKLSDMIVKINTWTELSAAIMFSGHVEVVSIHLAKSKQDYNNWVYQKDFWLTDDNAMQQFETILDELTKLYEGAVNIDELL